MDGFWFQNENLGAANFSTVPTLLSDTDVPSVYLILYLFGSCRWLFVCPSHSLSVQSGLVFLLKPHLERLATVQQALNVLTFRPVGEGTSERLFVYNFLSDTSLLFSVNNAELQ